MDESRKQFERWITSLPMCSAERHRIDNERYRFNTTEVAWKAWQASRAAIEIKLPDFYDYTDQDTTRAAAEKSAYNSGLYDSQEAIRATGIKVKE